MQMPHDLAELHRLRKRGQCPKLPVFVTTRWEWQQKLLDLGSLCIRVRNPSDCDYDWSAIRGLHCILVQDGGDFAALGQALLGARPYQLETFHPNERQYRKDICPCFSRLVCGDEEPWDKIMQRDALLWRLLRKH